MSGCARLILARCMRVLFVLLLVGCAPPELPPQGPTGHPATPSARESYLIPPEIPATLLDYLFAHQAPSSEIISIAVADFSSDTWTLHVTTEQLPDAVRTERRRFLLVDGSWRER